MFVCLSALPLFSRMCGSCLRFFYASSVRVLRSVVVSFSPTCPHDGVHNKLFSDKVLARNASNMLRKKDKQIGTRRAECEQRALWRYKCDKNSGTSTNSTDDTTQNDKCGWQGSLRKKKTHTHKMGGNNGAHNVRIYENPTSMLTSTFRTKPSVLVIITARIPASTTRPASFASACWGRGPSPPCASFPCAETASPHGSPDSGWPAAFATFRPPS